MKRRIPTRSLSILLAALMVISSMVITALPAAAVDATGTTAPEVVVKGEVDVWDKTTQTQPTQTDADGYILITSAAELVWWIKNTVAGVTTNYRLTTSVDLQSVNLGPDTNRVFEGIFDGAGYTILNLRCAKDWSSPGGQLFAKVTGTIQDLNLVNFKASGGNQKASFITSLDGGTLRNVRADVNISGTSYGAFIQYAANDALIENVVISGSVSTSGNAGDAASLLYELTDSGATVRNCANYATITSTNGNAAGLIAFVSGETAGGTKLVENCVNYGTVSTSKSGTYAGGICARTQSCDADPMTFKNCVNYGAVTQSNATTGYAHGIVGIPSHNAAGIIYLEGCVNYGDITATTHTGGIVSYSNKAVQMIDCVNYGTIVCTSGEAGGLAGKIVGRNYASRPSALIAYNCANYGDVTGATYAGGMAGSLQGGDSKGKQGMYLHGCISVGTVTGTTASAAGAAYLYKDGKIVLEVENSYLNGVICGSATEELTSVVIGSNVYADLTAGDVLGANNASVDVSAVQQYSATDMASGAYLETLNTYAGANGYTTWYQSGTHGAPCFTSLLQLTRATVMIADYIFVVAQAEDIVALPANTTLEVRDQEGRVVVGTPAEDNTYQFVLEGINLTDIATDRQYTMLVGGEEATVSYSFSVIDLLADLYNDGNTSPNKQTLIHNMVNVCYVAGHTDAFTKFNAAAETSLEPLALADVAPLADAGDVFTYDGCKIALDLVQGFTLVGYDENDNVVGTVVKGVYNVRDVVAVGTAGETTVAAMLNAYLGMDEYHDLAAACILYCQAAELVNP